MKPLSKSQLTRWINRLTPLRFPSLSSEGPQKRVTPEMAKLLFSLLDITALTGNETYDTIKQLCALARKSYPSAKRIRAAGVCVYPCYVSLVSKNLKGSGVRTICAAGGFPHAQTPLKFRLQEVAWCLSQGAEEVDVPLNRSLLENEGPFAVYSELLALRRATKGHGLKIILETGEMADPHSIYIASLISLFAGADFLKTSTGKAKVGATLPAFAIMCLAVREFLLATGRRAGVKPAGGIQTTQEALAYIQVATQFLGEQCLVPDLFRIGASALHTDLIKHLSERAEESYQSPSRT